MNAAVREIAEQFSKGNFPSVYNFMADDIQWNIIGGSLLKGKEAVIEYCNKMMVEMENAALINKNIITGETGIAIQGYCDYTTENGKPGKVEYCNVYNFKNEKLQEITSYVVEIKFED